MFKSESKKSYHYFVDCNVTVESEEVDVSSFRSVKHKTKPDKYLLRLMSVRESLVRYQKRYSP